MYTGVPVILTTAEDNSASTFDTVLSVVPNSVTSETVAVEALVIVAIFLIASIVTFTLLTVVTIGLFISTCVAETYLTTSATSAEPLYPAPASLMYCFKFAIPSTSFLLSSSSAKNELPVVITTVPFVALALSAVFLAPFILIYLSPSVTARLSNKVELLSVTV